VIDSLCDEPDEEDIAVAAFYCDFRDQQEQTTDNIIWAILKELVAREQVLGHMQTVFQKVERELSGRGLASGYDAHAEAGYCHITTGLHLYWRIGWMPS